MQSDEILHSSAILQKVECRSHGLGARMEGRPVKGFAAGRHSSHTVEHEY